MGCAANTTLRPFISEKYPVRVLRYAGWALGTQKLVVSGIRFPDFQIITSRYTDYSLRDTFSVRWEINFHIQFIWIGSFRMLVCDMRDSVKGGSLVSCSLISGTDIWGIFLCNKLCCWRLGKNCTYDYTWICTAAYFRAERLRDCRIDAQTRCTFSGVLTFGGRPLGFLGNAEPLALTFETHRRIVFRSGTASFA
jgi:hypothetical protein